MYHKTPHPLLVVKDIVEETSPISSSSNQKNSISFNSHKKKEKTQKKSDELLQFLSSSQFLKKYSEDIEQKRKIQEKLKNELRMQKESQSLLELESDSKFSKQNLFKDLNQNKKDLTSTFGNTDNEKISFFFKAPDRSAPHQLVNRFEPKDILEKPSPTHYRPKFSLVFERPKTFVSYDPQKKKTIGEMNQKLKTLKLHDSMNITRSRRAKSANGERNSLNSSMTSIGSNTLHKDGISSNNSTPLNKQQQESPKRQFQELLIAELGDIATSKSLATSDIGNPTSTPPKKPHSLAVPNALLSPEKATTPTITKSPLKEALRALAPAAKSLKSSLKKSSDKGRHGEGGANDGSDEKEKENDMNNSFENKTQDGRRSKSPTNPNRKSDPTGNAEIPFYEGWLTTRKKVREFGSAAFLSTARVGIVVEKDESKMTISEKEVAPYWPNCDPLNTGFKAKNLLRPIKLQSPNNLNQLTTQYSHIDYDVDFSVKFVRTNLGQHSLDTFLPREKLQNMATRVPNYISSELFNEENNPKIEKLTKNFVSFEKSLPREDRWKEAHASDPIKGGLMDRSFLSNEKKTPTYVDLTKMTSRGEKSDKQTEPENFFTKLEYEPKYSVQSNWPRDKSIKF